MFRPSFSLKLGAHDPLQRNLGYAALQGGIRIPQSYCAALKAGKNKIIARQMYSERLPHTNYAQLTPYNAIFGTLVDRVLLAFHNLIVRH